MYSLTSRRSALILLLALTVATVCNAQVPLLTTPLGGTLTGRVLNQNRDPLAGATIIVTKADGSAVASETANQNGEFVIALAAGGYTVKVVMHGFSDATQSVRVDQSAPASLEIILQVAGLSSSVTVVAVDGYQSEAILSAKNPDSPARHAAINFSRYGGTNQRSVVPEHERRRQLYPGHFFASGGEQSRPVNSERQQHQRGLLSERRARRCSILPRSIQRRSR